MLWRDSYVFGLHLSEDQIDDVALGRTDEHVFIHLLICELCLKRLFFSYSDTASHACP